MWPPSTRTQQNTAHPLPTLGTRPDPSPGAKYREGRIHGADWLPAREGRGGQRLQGSRAEDRGRALPVFVAGLSGLQLGPRLLLGFAVRDAGPVAEGGRAGWTRGAGPGGGGGGGARLLNRPPRVAVPWSAVTAVPFPFSRDSADAVV